MDAVPKIQPKTFHLHKVNGVYFDYNHGNIPSGKVPSRTSVLPSSHTSPVIHTGRRRNCRRHFSDARSDHEVEARDDNKAVDDTGWSAIVEGDGLFMSVQIES